MSFGYQVLGFGTVVDVAPPFINLQASDWEGDTDSATLGDGTVRMTGTDDHIRTSLTFIGANEDFDFQATYLDSSTSYIIMGWGDDNNASAQAPDLAAPNPHTQDFGNPGYKRGNNVFETTPSAGWMSNRVNGISRRGDVFYGMADGVVEHTWHSSNNTTAAGMLFFGQGGGNLVTFVVTDVQYRKAATGGLPELAT